MPQDKVLKYVYNDLNSKDLSCLTDYSDFVRNCRNYDQAGWYDQSNGMGLYEQLFKQIYTMHVKCLPDSKTLYPTMIIFQAQVRKNSFLHWMDFCTMI